MEKMNCYQCEQTSRHTACTSQGVCGKSATESGLMDLIIALTIHLAITAQKARAQKIEMKEVNELTAHALFTTITNVNFAPITLMKMVEKINHFDIQLSKKINEKRTSTIHFMSDEESMAEAGFAFANAREEHEKSPTLTGLRQTVIYGIKGICAYADHAMRLGAYNDTVFEFIHRALAKIASNDYTTDEMLALALECGQINLIQMQVLHEAHVKHFGEMTPCEVFVTPVKGKCILISGHDMRDLETLLIQTQDKNINVYTHGEMLTAHAYPNLKKYKHLVGNYGSAWQNQAKEFAEFPGAILMTTNCIQKPLTEYHHRIFTTGLVQYQWIKHVENGDFEPVIACALKEKGFESSVFPAQKINVGFNCEALTSVASTVVEAVKSKKIRHFFLVGGCDGAKMGRNYYTDLVTKIPHDCIILTLACGKYRFNKLDLGNIDGIPRLLDVGQCNDAYGAVQIALLLAKAFNCGVNELPLSFILSWYEQKAVAVLLTLLSLGIEHIKLGPTLPAFLTPEALAILIEKFKIAPISTPEADLAFALNGNQ